MSTDLKDSYCPQGNELTARNKDYRNDLHSIIDKIRKTSPVYKDDVFQRWIVTTHDGTKKILKNITSCGRDWGVSSEGTWGKTVSQRVAKGKGNGKFGMVDVDGEEHRRLRSRAAKMFSPPKVVEMRAMVERIADELIQEIHNLDTFDFIQTLAAPFPTLIMAELLGVEPKDQENFKRWSEEWILVCDPDITPSMAKLAADANVALTEYFVNAVEERTVNPGNDVISRLISGAEKDDVLSLEEIVTIGLQLIVAGNITSTDLIGNGMVALLKNPEQLEKLRKNPELIHKTAEEMLRFDAPVTEIPRFCYTDVDVEGRIIEKGQTLTLNLAGSNHDPAAYHCPHKFDIEREGPSHHAFGGGAHQCLGIHLARLEIEVIFKKVLAAFPTLKLTDASLERKAIPTFSGYKKVMLSTK
ncbi:MAG: cytochrome P-450 like protein [marine bacterium B5-7]|nr:MAG: cytochrome P-450 like protein [marine bacterium B5-7]